MSNKDLEPKAHWEEIYSKKALEDFSWYEHDPALSLKLIAKAGLQPENRILIVGAGDSLLPDSLLARGFSDLHLLDISRLALERARKRLGDHLDQLTFIEANVLDFTPAVAVDLWFDRACFHFLTSDTERENYVHRAASALKPGASLILGVFSDEGPEKCSGVFIRRHSLEELKKVFIPGFDCVFHLREVHLTPAGKEQDFLWCIFERN